MRIALSFLTWLVEGLDFSFFSYEIMNVILVIYYDLLSPTRLNK